MQSYAVQVLLVATVFAHVNARVASGVSSGTNNVEVAKCPYEGVPDTINTMINKLKDCIKPSDAFHRQFTAAHDVDAYRRLFRSACSQRRAVKTCFASVNANAASCLNEVERKLWATVLVHLGTCVTEVCANDSEVVANIFGVEFKALTLANQRRGLSCIQATAVQTLFDRETDLPAYTLRKYRAMKSGKQCILNVAKQGQTSANQTEQFMDRIISSMNCLTPVTNEIVLCETLDAGNPIGHYDE